jgi:hypothetical protein
MECGKPDGARTAAALQANVMSGPAACPPRRAAATRAQKDVPHIECAPANSTAIFACAEKEITNHGSLTTDHGSLD